MDRDLRIRLLLEAMDKVTGPMRAMAGGAGKASEALRATRERLKQLERAQGDIAGFRDLKQGLRTTETRLSEAQAKVAGLAREMAAADNPTKKLATAFQRAQREAQGLKREHVEGAQKLQLLRDRLSAAGLSTGNLASDERRLRNEMAAANREMDEQRRKLDAINSRAQNFATGRDRFSRVQGMGTGLAAGGTAAIGTGIAAGAPLIAAYGAARDFQAGMTDIAQKADLSRASARAMGLEIVRAAKAANQLPEDLRAGVDVLAGMGLDPRRAAEMMTPIGRAATAYKAEIADLSSAAFAANDNLKVPINQTARLIDVMAQAGKSGAFEIRDMAQYFPTLTAGYQALGQKGVAAAGDLAAALQIARKGAGSSEQAATNVANLIQKMAAPDTIKNFKKMGVDLPAALKRMYAEGKTPLEAISELTNKTLNGDLGRIGFLFGDAQAQQALRPLIQNLEQYRAIRADALGASGVVDRDFEGRLQDAAEQQKAFQIGSQQLALTMGTLLLPTINAVMAKATAFANRLSAWADRNPRLAKTLAIIAASVAGLMILFGGIAIVAAGVLAPFAALAFVAGALGIGLLPVIGIAAAVVAGITALGAAALYVYNNWDGIVAWFTGLWTNVKTVFFDGIRAFVAVHAMMFDIGRNLVMGLIRGILGMLGRLKDTVLNVAGSAVQWFKGKLGIQSPSRVFAGLGGFVMEGLTQGIAGGEQGPLRRISALAGDMTRALAIGAAAPAAAVAGIGGASGAGAGGAGPAAAPAVYNITIHAEGRAAQDIAREVRAAIEQIEREKGARARSAYRDGDN